MQEHLNKHMTKVTKRKNPDNFNEHAFSAILDEASVDELQILRKNEDLMARVQEISRMDKKALSKCIREEHNFSIDDCNNGDIWIDASTAAERFLPSWVGGSQLPYCGWYLEFEKGEENDFTTWARNLLFQEVRVNIWIRYMEHKIDLLAKHKNPFQLGSSNRLIGSGGNYI